MCSEDANSTFFLPGAAAAARHACRAAAPASRPLWNALHFPRSALPPPTGSAEEEPAWPICGAWRVFRRRHLPPDPTLWQNKLEGERRCRPADSASMGRACLHRRSGSGRGSVGSRRVGALAQPRDAPPPGTGELPQAASPRGATYIPGVGFRFVPPAGPRVYGYYYGPGVYGHYDDRESQALPSRLSRPPGQLRLARRALRPPLALTTGARGERRLTRRPWPRRCQGASSCFMPCTW